jgi:predicted transcriptional regulator
MTAFTVELNDEQAQRLARACKSTGVEASVAVADALAVYEPTLDDDYRPSLHAGTNRRHRGRHR